MPASLCRERCVCNPRTMCHSLCGVKTAAIVDGERRSKQAIAETTPLITPRRSTPSKNCLASLEEVGLIINLCARDQPGGISLVSPCGDATPCGCAPDKSQPRQQYVRRLLSASSTHLFRSDPRHARTVVKVACFQEAAPGDVPRIIAEACFSNIVVSRWSLARLDWREKAVGSKARVIILDRRRWALSVEPQVTAQSAKGRIDEASSGDRTARLVKGTLERHVPCPPHSAGTGGRRYSTRDPSKSVSAVFSMSPRPNAMSPFIRGFGYREEAVQSTMNSSS